LTTQQQAKFKKAVKYSLSSALKVNYSNIKLMPISCHFQDCKALLSMCSSWSSTISSTGPLPFTFINTYNIFNAVHDRSGLQEE